MRVNSKRLFFVFPMLLSYGSSASARTFDVTLCGSDLQGSAPKIVAKASSKDNASSNKELCGEKAPVLDLANHDPFATIRYKAPANNLVPPFAACQEAYQEMMNRRPQCNDSTAKKLLVSKKGVNDPRYRTGQFSAVFATVQEAINAAQHCDKVIVRPGVYQEYLSIKDKDVKVFSDTWNEAGTLEDGNELDMNYVAEKIDLEHYYTTGERKVLESRGTYRKPLKRAVRTVIQGGGYADGPTLGGKLGAVADDLPANNKGCGVRKPLMDFIAGTTRSTEFDGFTLRLMPQQDHTLPGHGHVLQMRGASPIIRNNIMYNNGSTGVGIHANFIKQTPFTVSCEADRTKETQNYKNEDFRTSNIQYRPVPLIYGNIAYQNNGLGFGNNHYSCAVMTNNEAFWNGVPGEEDSHESPGIGSRHGAKTCIDLNISYENAWVGIGAHQGSLEPKAACVGPDMSKCLTINERTQTMITRNIVFNNGHQSAPTDSVGGIGVDGVGLPNEPAIVAENISFSSRISGIGARSKFAGKAEGYVLDDTFVKIKNNVVFSNGRSGIGCDGSFKGTTNCMIEGNESFHNNSVGIGFGPQGGSNANTNGWLINNTAACNGTAGMQTFTSKNSQTMPVLNNIAYANETAGVVSPATNNNGSNLLSANMGHPVSCENQAPFCKFMQIGLMMGGAEGKDNLFVDPMFKNPLGFDFSLQENSSARGKAAAVNSFTTGSYKNIGARN